MDLIGNTIFALFPFFMLFGLYKLASYHEKANNPELLDDEGAALDVPPLDTLMTNPAELIRLRDEVFGIGFIHRVDTINELVSGNSRRRKYKAFVLSEIYIIRSDGVPQTIEQRKRPVSDIHDVEGEELARRLAEALGQELHVA